MVTSNAGAGGVIVGTIGALAEAVAADGFVGALMDWRLPEDSLKEYENGVMEGHILMGARTNSDEQARLLKEEWRQYETVNTPAKVKIGVL